MKFRIFTEPQQGASYRDLLAVAQAAERLGFDGFFRSDHFLAMGAEGLPGPSDAWTTLAGIARETDRIRIGTLVSSATFRHPSVLAVQVANVDGMSDGRVEFGLGTGWFREEHEALGIPFPRERFGMLREQLEIITGYWDTPVGPRFSYEGDHYTLRGAPALPKPVQPRIPVIVGGVGRRRTPALAARLASEYNVAFRSDAEIVAAFTRTREACEIAGRDPATMTFSAALTVAAGRTDAEYRRRVEAIGRDARTFREEAVGGTTDQVIERIQGLRELGVQTLYLQVLDLQDLEHLEFLAGDVLPPFA